MSYFLRLCIFAFVLLFSGGIAVALVASIDFLPWMLFSLGVRGVLLLGIDVPLAFLSACSLSLMLAAIGTLALERLLEAPYVKSLCITSIPLLLALSILVWGRSETTAGLIVPSLGCLLVASALVPLVVLRLHKKSEARWQALAALLFIAACSFLAVGPLPLLWHSASILYSFPSSTDFETRSQWTLDFLQANPNIQRALDRSLPQPDATAHGFAFSGDGLHTVALDWMDGPRFSAVLDHRDGRKSEICERSPQECLFAGATKRP